MNLRRQTIAAFVSPAIPIAALGLPLVVYLPPFYAKEMGLGLSVVGTIFMITRFWDVFTDPVLGILSDKIKTPLGRRRHWIVLSVPILMICVYKVFMPQPPITWADATVSWRGARSSRSILRLAWRQLVYSRALSCIGSTDSAPTANCNSAIRNKASRKPSTR